MTMKRATSGTVGILVGLFSIVHVLVVSSQNPTRIQLTPLPVPAPAVATPRGQGKLTDPFGDAIASVLRERLAVIHTRGQLTAEQKLALKELSERSKAGVEIRLRSEAGTPRHIKGEMLEKASAQAGAGEDRDEK